MKKEKQELLNVGEEILNMAIMVSLAFPTTCKEQKECAKHVLVAAVKLNKAVSIMDDFEEKVNK